MTPRLLAAAALFLAAPVFAQEGEVVEKPSDDVQHDVSLTFSPFHLALPMIELTGEWRASDKLGLAGVVGLGTVDVEGLDDDAFVGELAAQLRYYVLGSFIHGMQLGTEVSYLHVAATSGEVDAVGQGLGIAPFIGYKIATNVGFTFDAQVGPQFLVARGEATDGARTESAKHRDVGLLLNLNVGWSF